jgi:alkylresorcinol/alkylpyrone synthase
MNDPRVVAIATATPDYSYSQEQMRAFASRVFSPLLSDEPNLLGIFENAEINTRHLCLPLEWLEEQHSFAEKNARYIQEAESLGTAVARRVLERAQLEATDIDHVFFISSTGISTPSIDALIANGIGLRGDVRRTPVWGLGCAGGAAGLSRARDVALAHPDARVLVISLEVCSATFLNNDLSKRNLVAASLFSDGAAAVVVAGGGIAADSHPSMRPLSLRASHSMLWKDTLDVMGWELEPAGLRVVFSRSIPHIVMEHVPASLETFLSSQGLALGDVRHVIAHPGGIKVLRAYKDALELDWSALTHAREVLRDFGNMSSPSCLFVLERFLDSGDIAPGDHGVVMALGPGFSSEYVLVRGED